MTSMQYTIRAIPKGVDTALRQQAQKTGKSLNEVVIDTLAKGVGVSAKTTSYNDLDWFIGNHTLDTSFDTDLSWLDSAPRDIT